MDKEFRTFNSKLLLFGEYTVLEGSSALACPFEKFSARFSYGDSNNFLGFYEDFYNYMKALDLSPWKAVFREEAFKKACESGMYFDPEIPVGYGIGSSGAFTAAVFDAFIESPEPQTLKYLKTLFAAVENYFHGESSGFDPLVSYINKPVLKEGNGDLSVVELPENYFHPYGIYLIDSGVARSTAKYVEIFKEKLKDIQYREKYILPLVKINQELIANYSKGKVDLGIIQKLTMLSHLQLQAFREMILPEVAEIWKEVYSFGNHLIKLCGAGGGGFYYLFTSDIEDFTSLYPEVKPIEVFREKADPQKNF